MMPRAKDVVSVLLVGAVTSVWLYQTLDPALAEDFAVKALALTFAAAGGITLFGRGTMQAAKRVAESTLRPQEKTDE